MARAKKARRFDFEPSLLISGAVGLTPDQFGIYWHACTVQYSKRRRIRIDDDVLVRTLKVNPKHLRAVIDQLVEKGKLMRDGDLIWNEKAEEEIEAANGRISASQANGSMGGRPAADPAPITSGSAGDHTPDQPPIMPGSSSGSAPILPAVSNDNSHLENPGVSGGARPLPLPSPGSEPGRDSAVAESSAGLLVGTPDAVEEAYDRFRDLAMACSLSVPDPRPRGLTERRRRALKLRLREAGGIAGWQAVLSKIRDTPGLRGADGRWRVNLDWLLNPANFVKVKEGAYDHWGAGTPTRSGGGGRQGVGAAAIAAAAEAARRLGGEGRDARGPGAADAPVVMDAPEDP